jgi:hypothetical protein
VLKAAEMKQLKRAAAQTNAEAAAAQQQVSNSWYTQTTYSVVLHTLFYDCDLLATSA